ncbi:sodium:solute symporter family transporter, partial [Alistipes indistinctus]|uniref:sodium:solute symporter family transporter n=1 Tax=Alistipes indistinctus TaxID=626932 RepID=UPI0024BA4597
VALIPVFGLDPGWVPPVSVVLVVITVIYTTMGGLKAVVTTDVIQTVVMFAGVLLTIGIIGWKVGSFGAFFEPQLFEHWPPVDWGFDMSKRMTVGNILLMTLVWQVCTAGSDQMAIQRYLSTPDVATAKRSYRISLVTSCTIQLLLAVVGLVVMTYFLRYPQMLAPGTSVVGDADTLFPRFILIGLPAGITGLIAAGIMSAAMSSLSSGLNSSATVIYEDIINRNRKESNTSSKSLHHIKLIAVALGVVVALSSFLVAYVSGNLLDVVIKVVNLVVAPLFVLFFMARFVPWATSRGTVAGGLFAMLVAVLIAFVGIFGITALWIMPVALVSGVLSSMLFSLLDRWLIGRGLLPGK